MKRSKELFIEEQERVYSSTLFHKPNKKMAKDKVYWTMKNGYQIDVDRMDIDHLRNTLKMIIRNADKASVARSRRFTINGELAQEDADRYEICKYTGLSDSEFYDEIFNP